MLQVLAFVPPAHAEQFCWCASGWALDPLDGLFLKFFFSPFKEINPIPFIVFKVNYYFSAV